MPDDQHPPERPEQPGPTESPAHDSGVDDELDEEYIYVPAQRSVWRRAGVITLAILLLVSAVLGGAVLWIRDKLEPGGAQEPVSFVIPPESTTAQIAGLLEDEGVIADATIFRYYVRWSEPEPFRAGEYEGLTTNQAVWDVIDALEEGPLPPPTSELVVPEGLWLSEVRELALDAFPDMTEEGWEHAVSTVRSRYQPEDRPLEGLVFPATYSVEEDERHDEVALVEQMVATFDQVADEIDLEGRAAALNAQLPGIDLGPYDVVTIASMVEAETRVSEEMDQVARVMYNRMTNDMRLDIDATVLYAIGERVETLTQSQLETDAPHNTRLHPGLPPTPIAAPGRAALEAALEPAEGDWLYYVLADEEGNHFFTADHEEFQRAAQDARDRGLFE